MSVIATGSKFSAQNWIITAFACLIFAGWFAYDGWFNKEYQQKETRDDGRATVNLLFNRFSPVPLAIIAVFSIVMSNKIKKRKIIADEKGVTLNNGQMFSYSDISKIDKRDFDKGGAFYVEYKKDGIVTTAKFDNKKFDNLGLLLDEIIKQTGAKPQSN